MADSEAARHAVHRESTNNGSLVPAWRDVAPVGHRVIDGLVAGAAIAQRELAIVDLVAARALLHVVEVAQRVLVLDLGRFLAAQGDGPVSGVYTAEHHRAGIPIGHVAIQATERAGDIHRATRAIRASRHSYVEGDGHGAQ